MSGPVQPPLTVETIDGATVGRPITKIKVTNGTLAVSGSTATLTISGGGGGSGTVTSVGLTETGTALTITGSPVTTSGTINIAGAGTSSQVILGDLSLGTLTSGTVTGTGTSGQVSYWNGTSSQTGSANLTFDGTNLKVGGYTEVGTKITTPTGTDLTLDTVGGTNSGSIVIADGVDGQVSISANGSGPIKLGAANNPVTVSNVYTLPTAVTTDNNYVLTAQTDGSTAWAASGGGGGGIGGSISDNQIAVGATTADEIEGSSNLTFDGTMLKLGSGLTTAKLSSNGSQDLVLTTNTNAGFTEPYIQLNDSASGNISINSGNSGATKINIGRDTTRWVQINNDYYLPQSDGSTNQFLKTNGSGTLSFSDVTPTFPLNGPDDSATAPNYSWTNASTSGLFRLTSSTVGISAGGSAAMYFQSGKVEANKTFEVLAGSAVTPSLTFSGDNDTGLFSAAADAIGFSVGGNERMRIANNAIEGITFRVDGTDTASAPGFSFDPDNDTGMFSVSAATNTLSFSTGGTERLRIGSSGEILIGGTAAGDAGQVLTSGGSGAAVSWAAAGGGIGGAISDNQVAYGDLVSNDIEGNAKFTYDVTTQTLNIAGGTGTGTILSGSSDMVIRNSSATSHSKITLGYDANNSNIKLDTDGTGLVEIHKEGSLAYSLPNAVTTTNDYVLTAQTDGTTAWAAGGGTKRNYQGLLTPFSTSVKTWDITRQTPFSSGSNGSTQFGALFNNSGIAFCFSAPQSGTPTEIGVIFGSSSSGGINFAIYDSNADGTPNQLIAEGTAAYSASSVVYDTSLTGQSGGSVGEMVAGELMWCVMTRTDGSVATVMQCSSSGTRGKSAAESTVGGSAGNCIETTSFNASTSFTNTAPAISSWGPQNTLIPIIGVRF